MIGWKSSVSKVRSTVPAGSPAQPRSGRPHFAAWLVETGHVATAALAFRRYLGAGKPDDVKAHWPELHTVADWVCDSGGTAILAHPGKYRMTNTKLATLVREFREVGGRALEVICGSQTRDLTRKLANLADDFGMLASCGSDFHAPGRPWSELGAFEPLPRRCRPVWEAL